MIWALYTGWPGMDPHLELHGVQVTPEAFLLVILGGERLPSLRVGL